jgi:pimeloyl-ACP methyl ester carboxylesterase
MVAAATSRRIKLHTGLTYHLLSWGPEADPGAAAPIVVLLHGFLDFAWTWEAMAATGILSRYHLVAPDLRGYGDSDRIGPGGYYHFMDYVADVEALVENLRGVGQSAEQAAAPAKVSIVGHSMGGSVAAYFTGAYPELVERLIILEGLGPPDQPIEAMPERLRAWLAAWRRVGTQQARPMADLDEAAARLRRHDPRLEPVLARRLAERGTVEVEGEKRVFKHDPLHLTPGPYPFTVDMARALWRRISCPTLLVAAQDSEFKYEDAELARRVACFPNARVVTLPDCGHMMQRHQPAALARLIAEFLG